MELKNFQRAALDTLAAYLERARISGDDEQAFAQVLRQREPDKTPPPYRTITGLPGVPNVCLRLPTGAGKTCWPRIPSPWRAVTFSNATFPWCCGSCRPTPFACRPPRR
jgi:hypothetical protein